MPETVFYDGECGFCHRSVRFILARDGQQAFRFAPLQGETFQRQVPRGERAGLPDSLIVRTASGRLLSRSDATRHVLARLGGAWALAAAALGLLPRGLRNRAYDAFARRRHHLFPRPADACPALPAALRARFDP